MSNHVCPWWLGYFLASPIRKWGQDPERILSPYLKEGMVALDIGSGMGFFTLPMAKLVGSGGHVIAVDLQEKMIRSLKRRANKTGMSDRIAYRICGDHSLGIDDLAGKIDFALAFAVLHEMPDIRTALASIAGSLKPDGKLLIAEPSGHVKEADFDKTMAIARDCGLTLLESPTIRRCRAAVTTRR